MHAARNITLASAVAVILLTVLLMWEPQRSPVGPEGAPIMLYCAAGVTPPVEEVIKEYEQAYGRPIQVNPGGSGALLSTLRVTTAGDLFLAADAGYIETAREWGLVEEAIPLASMLPVIAVPKGNPKGIATIADLKRDDVRVALCNPDAASIGKITRKLLQASGDWEAIFEKASVLKPTVMDLANDIKIGAADAGLIWDAVCEQYPEMEPVHCPEFSEGEQKITIGVLTSCEQPAAALHFARYLGARDRGLKAFARRGYRPVQGDVWMDVPEVTLFSGGVNRLAVEDSIDAFEQREGVKVTRVYNGCGILVSQMKAGEKPDAYFACDVSFVDQVADMFLDRIDVSKTAMVFLLPKGNPKGIADLEDLTAEGLRVGMTNPEQSALGALTHNLFVEAGVLDAVMTNVRVQTPTADMLVNQTSTGALDVAIVYEANCAFVRDRLDVVPIPHPKALAIQPYTVSKKTDHHYLLERLLTKILSAESQETFEKMGFDWVAE